jgi:hypothetical protein
MAWHPSMILLDSKVTILLYSVPTGTIIYLIMDGGFPLGGSLGLPCFCTGTLADHHPDNVIREPYLVLTDDHPWTANSNEQGVSAD